VTLIRPELFATVLIQFAPTPPLSASGNGLSPTISPGGGEFKRDFSAVRRKILNRAHAPDGRAQSAQNSCAFECCIHSKPN
jgi:hypothetical protein